MSISLVAVGDISFGDHFVCTSFGVNSFLKKNPDFDIFEDVKHILKSGDIVFGNLETVLSNHNLNEKNVHSYHMRGKKEYVSYLVNSGFNVINIANNHILQHGDAAFYYTVNLLERNNIKIVGIAERNGLNSKPCNLYIQRKKIVFFESALRKQ